MVSRHFSGMICVNLLAGRYPRNFDLSKEKDLLIFEPCEESNGRGKFSEEDKGFLGLLVYP